MHYRNQEENNIAVNFTARTCLGKALHSCCDNSGSVYVNIFLELMFDGMCLDQPVNVDYHGRFWL